MLARPRRSVLYMPGSNGKALAKAATLAADALILDLEDSVAPDAKEMARKQVMEAAAGDFGGREVVIRVNGPHTPWGPTDLVAAAAAGPDAILLPKVDGPGAVMLAARIMRDRWRAGEDAALGDDGNPERYPQRWPDRRRRGRFDIEAGSSGHGPQRSRQGNARPAYPWPAHHDGLSRQQPRRRPGSRGATSSTASTTTSRISTVFAPNACRGGTSASTARR